MEIVEVDKSVLREDLDEKLDGYNENWFEGIDDESYIDSANLI